MQGHLAPVNSVSFSPNGKYIISGSTDGTVKIWETQTGKNLKTIVHGTCVVSVAFSPACKNDPVGGKYIISSGQYWKANDTIKLWDTKTGKEIRTFQCRENINEIAFSPNGNYIVAALGDYDYKSQKLRRLRLWETSTGKEVKTFTGHTGSVTSVDFSADGKYIVSGSDDETLKLWEFQTGKEVRTFQGHESNVTSVTFSPNNKYIISGSWDHKIKLWETSTGKELRTFTKYRHTSHSGFVTSIDFSPDGKYFVSGSEDETLKLWHIEYIDPDEIYKNKDVETFENNVSKIHFVTFSNSGKYIASCGYSNYSLWNCQTGRVRKFFNHELDNKIVFSPDDKYIISFEWRDIELFDFLTGTKIRSFKGHTDIIRSISFSPDGKYIVSRSDDGKIKIWETLTGRNLKTIQYGREDADVDCVAFSPACQNDHNGGKYIISAASTSKPYAYTIKLWDTKTGKEIKTFSESSLVTSVAFSPDSKFIISGGYHMKIKLWDIQSGNLVRTFQGHKDIIRSVAFSPDGKYIISGCGGEDNTIKLWETTTGKEVKTFVGHSGPINSLDFSPDGKRIISGSSDGSVKIWNPENGKLQLSLYSTEDKENYSKKLANDYVIYTPDGRYDGSPEGLKLLHYVNGMEIIPLESLFEQYYTPDLLAHVFQGEEFAVPEILIDDIKMPPIINITFPKNNTTLSNNQVDVTVKATDQGGGIDEIRVYLNGKMIQTTQRGFKTIEKQHDIQTKSFKISLVSGENRIKATSFSNQRTESNPDEITIFYKGQQRTSNLHVLIIGIDKYKNVKYNLNYAIADATAFKTEIEKGSQNIFNSINTVFIDNNNATREAVLQAFNNLKAKVKQEDVFIFYFAGHAVMSEEDKPQFYIIPHDVTQLYGNNQLLRNKAISANELQTFSTELKAQKQLFVFDACQSGGMTEMLAVRGAAEEKAIAQLARSTGTYWLTASNSTQFATEYAELGHGLFTYSILLGLQGYADGGSKDRKITVTELSTFLNDKVPELSKKYVGTAQYPSLYGYGMDFPIVIVN